MKVIKYTLVIGLTAMFLHGCGTSNVGGSGNAEEAVNSAKVQLVGLSYEAHLNRLLEVFQLDESSNAVSTLNDYRQAVESQNILSPATISALLKVYNAACEDVSADTIPDSMTYSELYYMFSGVEPGADEQTVDNEIDADFGDNGDDVIAFVRCYTAAMSLQSLRYQ